MSIKARKKSLIFIFSIFILSNILTLAIICDIILISIIKCQFPFIFKELRHFISLHSMRHRTTMSGKSIQEYLWTKERT